MPRHLILRLQGPLMSFGGPAVDSIRPTEQFPGKSLLTGLIANALGYRRYDHEELQRLQERIVHAVRIDREPASSYPLTDYQTAQVSSGDTGWTTWGFAETRKGADQTAPILRYPEYWADAVCTVALRLEPAEETPRLEEVEAALTHPARPLFIGRKTCLPSGPLLAGTQKGETALAALLEVPHEPEAKLAGRTNGASPHRPLRRSAYGGRRNNQEPEAAPAQKPLRCQWPRGEGDERIEADRSQPRQQADRRNWKTRIHGGGTWYHQGSIPAELLTRAD